MTDRNDTEEDLDEQSTISRRSMLGAVGGATGGTFTIGLVRPVSATSSNLKEIRSSTPVKELLSAVGNPEIVDQETKVYQGKEYSTRITEFKTKIGTLFHHEALSSSVERINQGETSVTFDIENLGRPIHRRLPNSFSETPVGVTFSLRYKNGATVLTTSVTEEERNQIEEKIDHDALVALHISSTTDFYYVKTTEGEKYRITSQEDRPKITNPSIESIATTQINASACFDCGTKTPFCIPRCAPKCNPLSGNALDCGACVADNCADVDVVSCAKCIASLPEHLV